MSCKRRHGVTQRRLTTHRDYAGKVKAIIDFLDEDSRTLENRLLRVMKQNIKAVGQIFFVQEYGKS
jgi:hypothetical protein